MTIGKEGGVKVFSYLMVTFLFVWILLICDSKTNDLSLSMNMLTMENKSKREVFCFVLYFFL